MRLGSATINPAYRFAHAGYDANLRGKLHMGANMRRAVLIAATVFIAYAVNISTTLAQGVWCEANCKALCTKIWGGAGAADCFARIPCSNYAGKACAPAAVVNARHITYCHANPGKGTCR
jgi:hypothetical protein